MANKFNSGQTEHRSTLPQLSDEAKPTLKTVLPSINEELTPLFKLNASATPDLTVSIGSATISNSETGKNRASLLGNAFTSGSLVFPAASGSDITVTTGDNVTLNLSVGNYIKALVEIDPDDKVVVILGIEGASIAAATLPDATSGNLPVGYIVVQNVAGVIQNIENSAIYQFSAGSGSGGAGSATSDFDIVEGQTGATITFNQEFVYNSKSKFYRNGVRMKLVTAFTTGAADNYADEYMEINNGPNSTQIALNPNNSGAWEATADEWFMLDFSNNATSSTIAEFSRAYADGTGLVNSTITNPGGNSQINLVGWSYPENMLPAYGESNVEVKVNGTSIERDNVASSSDIYYTEVVTSGLVTAILFNVDLTSGGSVNPDIRVIWRVIQSPTVDLQNIDSDIAPKTDDTYDLGSGTRSWKEIYVDETTAARNNYLEEGMQDFVIQDMIDVPNTAIVNRAQIPNLANDLKPRMGIERIHIQAIQKLQDEFGPNGEPVYSVPNDVKNQVRFVGNWATLTNVHHIYQYGQADSYMEVTFWGTGLNLLVLHGGTRDLRVSVDGGAEGSDIFVAASTILQGRNYPTNQVIEAISGLSEGIHTVKIRANGTVMPVYGFEIVNDVTALSVQQGDCFVDRKKVSHSALESVSYNSGFESGTLGTKGGNVLVYQKSDGTIGKAVTPTDASAQYLTSTDHSNESIIRQYNFREFGANRADDFSQYLSAVNAAFTLNDGTTSLVGSSVYSGLGGYNAVWTDAGELVVTFVGTGLDVVEPASDGNVRVYTVYVDNQASPGTITHTASGPQKTSTICSGLPYGTHTVKFSPSTGFGVMISDFIVYGPKQPVLPANATKLSSYFILADYAIFSGSGRDSISTGVIRKLSTRENVYVGTWTIGGSVDTNYINGFNIFSFTNTDYQELPFFGTGVNLRWRANTNAANANVYIDGLLLTAANFPSVTVDVSKLPAGCSFSAGVLDMSATATTNGAALGITGLSLGKHEIKMEKLSGSATYSFEIDIITPVYSPESNEPLNLQNNLPVGSNSLNDLREVTAIKEDIVELPNWGKAVGVAANPTTSSVSAIPMPDMQVQIRTKGNPIEISFDMLAQHDTLNADIILKVFVDGVSVLSGDRRDSMAVVGQIQTISFSDIITLAEGVHNVQIYWFTSSGTVLAWGNSRTLIVKEIK